MHKKFPLYRQVESVDCGPTCVQMVSAYHGKKHSLRHIKEGCSISRLGISVADVRNSCELIGLNTIVVRGGAKQLSRAPLPAILHWRNSHFVVLYDVQQNKKGENIYLIADPSFGKTRCTESDFETDWYGDDGNGTAILTEPTEEFDSSSGSWEKTDYTVLKKMLVKYKTRKTRLIFATALLLISAAFSWMLPILYQKVIDSGVMGQNMGIVWQLFLAQLAFFIGYMLSNNLSSILLMKLNFYIGVEYLSELLGKIIRLPIKYFDTRLNTDFIQRLDDQGRLQGFITYRFIELSFAVVNIIVFSALLAYYNAIALWIFLGASVLAFLWNLYFLEERKYIDYSRFGEQAKNRNIVYELIYGMTEIKVNNAQSTQIEVWRKNQERINEISLRSLILNYKQVIGSSTLNKIRDIVIITLCAYFVIEGQMTLGILMSVSYVLGQLSGPVSQMQSLVQEFQDARISMDRLSEVQMKEDESVGTQIMDITFNSGIKMDDISFKYEGSFNPYVIKGLTIDFPKGKTTAIVGNSGSGKTTLLKLILGFYYPQKGDLMVDDITLDKININSWRSKCGVVMQDGYIFSGTIAENIALGYKEIDYERVAECAKVASINDFIEKLPSRYKMMIGKSGLELSNGQKQRILIARAVYKNPELIIFDEATSSLDTVNERKIMDNLKEFFKERTVIIVAHRLSTVVNADKIIYLEDGRIMEEGSHTTLSAQKGCYYNLIKNQLELTN